ncbi:MAG: restriction endonuclease [bacterium]|nr:restriction endonuclease [bacterium]
MIPTQSELELPLLKALVSLGGSGRPQDIYPAVIGQFDCVTEADLAERLESGTPKLTNRIQWVRHRLIQKGEMASPQRGVWSITPRGRQRLESDSATPVSDSSDLLALYEEYERTFRQAVLSKLSEMSPTAFEFFARRLMEAYGFSQVVVTGSNSDGGIDGHGRLRVGLSLMDVAFQCKRWQGHVPRPEIDRFRGAIQGEFQQGIFFTTSDFSKGAQDVSLKRGAVPIVLLNGEAIVALMVEKEFGVRRRPLTRYDEVLSEIEGFG